MESGRLNSFYDYLLYREWCNYIQEEYLKRYYRTRDISMKFARLTAYYKRSLYRPLMYEKVIYPIQAKYYYFREKLAKGEDIYNFSRVDNDVC